MQIEIGKTYLTRSGEKMLALAMNPHNKTNPRMSRGNERTVAVLCVAPRSIYHSMPGVEAFDMRRDARTFTGGMPVVAHPWSAYCRQQVTAGPDVQKAEQEIGLWCVDQVRTWGGILEQPAKSHLWNAAGLPGPGDQKDKTSWSLEVWQAWWGYTVKKSTWLYFRGIDPSLVHVPLRLHAAGNDRRAVQLMSHRQRSATCLAFAEWLVDLARKSSAGAVA